MAIQASRAKFRARRPVVRALAMAGLGAAAMAVGGCAVPVTENGREYMKNNPGKVAAGFFGLGISDTNDRKADAVRMKYEVVVQEIPRSIDI